MSEQLNAAITTSKQIKVIAAICYMFLAFVLCLHFYRTAVVALLLCQHKNDYRNNTKTESIIAQMIPWKILSLCVCMDLLSHLIFSQFFFLEFYSFTRLLHGFHHVFVCCSVCVITMFGINFRLSHQSFVVQIAFYVVNTIIISHNLCVFFP